MQVRKLIRLLNEMIEKNPRLAYAEACIDTELGKSKASHYKFFSISDVDQHQTVWQSDDTVNENWRTVVVLGNF